MSDFYYDQNKLNKFFAIAALLLLVIMGAMFMKDYNRDWKQYQKQFRTMEVEKARTRIDREVNALRNDTAYQELLKELEEAKKDYEAKCGNFANLEEDIEQLRTKDALIVQDYKFRKAELDAVKYRFEYAQAHHVKNLAELEEEYVALRARVNGLALEAEESKVALQSREEIIEQCGQDLKKLERQEGKFAAKVNLIQRKLDTIDRYEMTPVNQIADMVRNFPILELANPTYKVQQIVLSDIHDDVVFKTVPRVERCITCHLGMANDDYKEEGNPYKSHPRLDLFVGKDSPHPMEEFGCTSCHSGRPRGTTFNGAVHVPQSPEQKKEWEEKYDYKQMALWEQPMHPLQYTEAGCFKCHMGDSRLKGAEKLNVGLSLIEKAGCYSCHEIEKYQDWPKPGPDLTQLPSKIDKEWAYKWVKNPHSFRHNTWMPAYFNQSNNSDEGSEKRSEQEVHAMVEYLFKGAKEFEVEEMSFVGDAAKGEVLMAEVGCYGCHLIEDQPTDEKETAARLARRHGPNLINIGSKTTAKWLFHWLKNPSQYHPETTMPDMRLSDQEAAHIAAYLTQDANPEFADQTVPPVDDEILAGIVTDFLKSDQTDREAEASLAKMSQAERLEFAGEKLIAHYGCYSCHNINGFDPQTKPIGAVLTYEGDKSLHKLDFGFIHIDHSRHGWFKQKVMNPRIFDEGKELSWKERLRMPNFNFDSEEADAIVTALLGFVDDKTVKEKIKPRTPENLLIEEGQEIITQLNCTGCHIMEGDGGYIAQTVTDWLINFEGRTQSEAEKNTESFSPPNLLGVGDKLNSKWLFEFLHNPDQPIRPWVKVRMPTFNFNEGHMGALVEYFNTLDGKSNFKMAPDTSLTEDEYQAAEKLFSADYLGCTLCHVVGDQLPTGTQDSWAPDLGWAKTRLDPEWMIRWIKDPSRLMPGTKMPTFYDPADYENAGPPDLLNGDEDEQIRILRNFLLTLSDRPLEAKSDNASVDEAISVVPDEPSAP